MSRVKYSQMMYVYCRYCGCTYCGDWFICKEPECREAHRHEEALRNQS